MSINWNSEPSYMDTTGYFYGPIIGTADTVTGTWTEEKREVIARACIEIEL